jgi:hypothetical protein
VQESKDNTVRLLAEHAATGQLPAVADTLWPNARDFPDRLRRHLRSAKRPDYVALCIYCQRSPRRETLLRDLQAAIRDEFHVAVTLGYGPRFLHSTGQLHKGGPNTGVFVQFTVADALDVPVPGEAYTFSVLKQAQALGDFQALLAHERRALRVDLGSDVDGGLRQVLATVQGMARQTGEVKTARKTARHTAHKTPRASAGKKTRAAANGARPSRAKTAGAA